MGVFIDLTGQKFGKLTAIRLSQERRSGRIAWICKCTCGTEKVFYANHLRMGRVTSCRLYKCVPNFMDLTGQKFWKLTAIEPVDEREQGHVVWKCACDCGKIIKKNAALLKRGLYPNCGSWECSPAFVDIAGKIFGRLTVIDFAEVRGGKRNTSLWNCRCRCGNVKKISLLGLTSGRTKSCGCIKSDGQYDSIIKRSYRSHIFAAKYRDIENFLSKDEYFKIASKSCHYCGNIDIKTNYTTKATINLNGVDRKNNEKFYSLENSLSSCNSCNTMKSDYKYEEFIDRIKDMCKYMKDEGLISSNPEAKT